MSHRLNFSLSLCAKNSFEDIEVVPRLVSAGEVCNNIPEFKWKSSIIPHRSKQCIWATPRLVRAQICILIEKSPSNRIVQSESSYDGNNTSHPFHTEAESIANKFQKFILIQIESLGSEVGTTVYASSSLSSIDTLDIESVERRLCSRSKTLRNILVKNYQFKIWIINEEKE